MAATLTSVLCACAAKQVAYVPPPPQVVVPPQPRPPRGAQANFAVPPMTALGMRQTVNLGITPAQTVWNLRSAYNVAALNCMRPQHTAILENYKAFLKANAKRLTAVNKQVDKEFKAKGASYIRMREAYMTQVYNFYALPPTLPAFCDAALAMSQQAAVVPAKGLDDFAITALPAIDRVFLDFYNSYDQYRADLAAWQARYSPTVAAPVFALPGTGGAAAGPPMPAMSVPSAVVPAPSAAGPATSASGTTLPGAPPPSGAIATTGSLTPAPVPTPMPTAPPITPAN